MWNDQTIAASFNVLFTLNLFFSIVSYLHIHTNTKNMSLFDAGNMFFTFF